MKMRIVIVLMLVAVIAGCATVEIDPALIGKILARRAGYELSAIVPGQAAELIPYAEEVIIAEDPKEAAEMLAQKLIKIQVPDDPLLGEDLKDLASIFSYDADWDNDYIDASRIIAKEFIRGIDLAQETL